MGTGDNPRQSAKATAGSGTDAGLLELTEATASVAPASRRPRREPIKELPSGTAVGRYLLLSLHGSGGMGAVYSAYDPELNRRVAIKLLRAGQDSARIRREAQAMALVTHPNVVRVYDVGIYEHQVFIAMELIDGVTLKEWLTSEARSWRRITDAMIQAGRGLAAAHRAGVIHRDVKPSNILVDESGGVYVLDFGVARAADDSTEAAAATAPDQQISYCTTDDTGSWSAAGAGPDTGARLHPRAATDELHTPLTEVGAVIGTPIYMAPEQRQGHADARSDQYSFCLTFFEALYGVRPADQETATAGTGPFRRIGPGRARSLDRPDDNLSHAHGRPPHWLRRALQRGLHNDPTQRYATMDALVSELARDRQTRRRRVLLAFAVLCIAGIAALVVTWQMHNNELCTGATTRLAGTWDDSVKQQIRASFMASDRPYAAETYARVERALDDYAENWVAMRTETCEATRLSGEQSAALMDLRMTCLDRELGAMRALTALFAESADGEVVDNAVRAALALPRVERCADVDALTTRFPLPEDPDARRRVQELQLRLEQITALQAAGKHADGVALARALAADVQKVDYTPLLAEVLLVQGDLEAAAGEAEKAEETFYRTAKVAAAAGEDELHAWAIISLVNVVGYRRARHERGLALGPLADAAVARAGNGALQRAKAANSQGLVLWSSGDYKAAAEKIELALELQEGELGPHHPDVGSTLNLVGMVYTSQGKYEQARPYIERALSVIEGALGPHHPDVALPLNNLGIVLINLGEFEQAQRSYERVLEIWENALGPDHPRVADALINLSNTLEGQKKFDEAIQACERALKIWEHSRRPDHPDVFYAYVNIGTILGNQDRCQEAESYFARALAGFEKALGPDHPNVTFTLTWLGTCLVNQGEERRAVPLLERAMTQCEARPDDQAQLNTTGFALARALWATGRERQRAIQLATSARDYFTATAADTKSTELAEMNSWLAEHSSAR